MSPIMVGSIMGGYNFLIYLCGTTLTDTGSLVLQHDEQTVCMFLLCLNEDTSAASKFFNNPTLAIVFVKPARSEDFFFYSVFLLFSSFHIY